MPSFILPFEKMHGLGNDFILIHHKYLPPQFSEEELALKLCDRHKSIGADGLIIVKPSTDYQTARFAWSYINSDGSLGQMCGNGIRCFAKYVFDRGLTHDTEFGVETLAGIIKPSIEEAGVVSQVKVNMGAPSFSEGKQINYKAANSTSGENFPLAALKFPENSTLMIPYDVPIKADDREFKFTFVSMGNPHAIIFLDSAQELQNLDLTKYGSIIEKHQFFPEKTNVEFVHIRSRNYIDFRVWERGCGITLACGTGACAAVVAAQIKGLVDDVPVTVNLPGGELTIEWNKAENVIYMTGPAESAFIGQVELEV